MIVHANDRSVRQYSFNALSSAKVCHPPMIDSAPLPILSLLQTH